MQRSLKKAATSESFTGSNNRHCLQRPAQQQPALHRFHESNSFVCNDRPSSNRHFTGSTIDTVCNDRPSSNRHFTCFTIDTVCNDRLEACILGLLQDVLQSTLSATTGPSANCGTSPVSTIDTVCNDQCPRQQPALHRFHKSYHCLQRHGPAATGTSPDSTDRHCLQRPAQQQPALHVSSHNRHCLQRPAQ